MHVLQVVPTVATALVDVAVPNRIIGNPPPDLNVVEELADLRARGTSVWHRESR
jgi:hypothetical protein